MDKEEIIEEILGILNVKGETLYDLVTETDPRYKRLREIHKKIEINAKKYLVENGRLILGWVSDSEVDLLFYLSGKASVKQESSELMVAIPTRAITREDLLELLKEVERLFKS